MKTGFIKYIGIAATAIGMGATLVTEWVNEQKMNEKIEEKVKEALANQEKEGEEGEEEES